MTAPASQILLVANNFPPVRGGSASVYAALARAAGGRITVLAPKINYADGLPIIGWREHDRLAPYRIRRVPLLRTTMGKRSGIARLGFLAWDVAIRSRVVFELLRLVLGGRVRTICIGELLASGWILGLLRHLPGVQTVVYVHGEEITTYSNADPWNSRGRKALRDADIIVVVSRFTLGVVKALLEDDKAIKIRLIENGVDTLRFSPGPKPSSLISLYTLDQTFVYLSVCRLLEKKGIDNTIRAFARITPNFPDSRYLVVGTGPFMEQLRALAKSEGVEDKVIFTGQIPDEELVDHYRLGDVFVMPNRRMPDGDTEGFGLVFLEANSCGIPVIAGCDGGSTDAVQDGRNGIVVDGASVDEIAEAMRRYREDPAMFARIKAQALETAASASWERKVEQFLNACDHP